jgi:hypothetical protein
MPHLRVDAITAQLSNFFESTPPPGGRRVCGSTSPPDGRRRRTSAFDTVITPPHPSGVSGSTPPLGQHRVSGRCGATTGPTSSRLCVNVVAAPPHLSPTHGCQNPSSTHPCPWTPPPPPTNPAVIVRGLQHGALGTPMPSASSWTSTSSPLSVSKARSFVQLLTHTSDFDNFFGVRR